MHTSDHIIIVGLGEVGRLAAAAFGDAGLPVIGVERDPQRREQAPRSIEVSPRLPRRSAEARAVVLCVGTPLAHGRPDPRCLIEAIEEVVRVGCPPLLVIESTVGPGFLDEEVVPRVPPGTRVAVAPERVDPGRQSPAYRSIPRVVGGQTAEATEAAAALYRSAGFQVHPTTARVALYAKHLENASRLVNIALVGEVASLCAAEGVDVDEVVRAASTKPFGYTPFWAGAGAGGECIPVDPAYLAAHAERIGVGAPLVQAALAANGARAEQVADRVTRALPGTGRRALLVGVAYKPGTADLRETPAARVAERLASSGWQVEWWDPLVTLFRGGPPRDLDRGPEGLDAVLILHPPPPTIAQWAADRRVPTFDACGALPAAHRTERP